MAIGSICATRSVVGEWTPTTRRYTVTFKATSDNALDGPATVLIAATQYFTLNNLNTYRYGNDVDTNAVLVNLTSPTRAGGNKSDRYWIFNAEYIYDQDMTPADMPVKIEPFFVKENEPIPVGDFAGFFTAGSNPSNKHLIPLAISNPDFPVGNFKPIQNSAKVPVLPAPERPRSKQGFRVSWTKKTEVNLAAFIDTVNIGAFLLQGVDSFNGTQTFFRLFPAGTLQLTDVQAPQREIYGRLWYDYTLEFVYDNYLHFELDRGLVVLSGLGKPDGRGGTLSSGDFPDGVPLHRTPLDPSGNPISEPILLDGLGNELLKPASTNPAPVYLAWRVENYSDFSQLPIGNVN